MRIPFGSRRVHIGVLVMREPPNPVSAKVAPDRLASENIAMHLYFKQIGVRQTKREKETSVKRRLEELSVPPAPGKKAALRCEEKEGAQCSRKCEAAVAVSRARAVQSKCRKLVTHLESQLKEAVGCEREAESHLAACVAEMAAAVQSWSGIKKASY